MLNLLSATLLFLFWGMPALAQAPPPPPAPAPPPAPLIYAPPSDAEIKEFTSEEQKFKVSFPGAPKTTISQTENFVAHFFSVSRSGSNSVVSVLKFNEDVEARQELIVKNVRERILKTPPPFAGATVTPPKILAENDIQVGKYKGKEFVYEASLKAVRVRILFVVKSIYEIRTDVTNWHILTNHYPEKVRAFEQETDRFFRSFQILE